MGNAIHVVKFVGAWFCIIAAIALIVIGHQPFGVAAVLALLAIAFSQAPSV